MSGLLNNRQRNNSFLLLLWQLFDFLLQICQSLNLLGYLLFFMQELLSLLNLLITQDIALSVQNVFTSWMDLGQFLNRFWLLLLQLVRLFPSGVFQKDLDIVHSSLFFLLFDHLQVVGNNTRLSFFQTLDWAAVLLIFLRGWFWLVTAANCLFFNGFLASLAFGWRCARAVLWITDVNISHRFKLTHCSRVCWNFWNIVAQVFRLLGLVVWSRHEISNLSEIQRTSYSADQLLRHVFPSLNNVQLLSNMLNDLRQF